MSNYPPGVTGNEPQITGEWPCIDCGGEGGDRAERTICPRCKGSGIEPEEFDVAYVEDLAETGTDKYAIDGVLDNVSCCVFDRTKPEDRRYLHAAAKLRARRREVTE